MGAFIHPGLAAAALGLAAIPLIIHLISRQRYRRERWAAMVFLRRAHRRSRRRLRLERAVLLLLRTAAILLLGLAVARPMVGASAVARAVGEARFDRVIILDDSGSMQALRGDGHTAFEAARDAALALPDLFGPSDGIAIVTASSPPRALIERPAHDRTLVRRLLGELRCGYSGTDLAGAMEKARTILAASDAAPDCRAVYVLTDMTRRSWRGIPSGETPDATGGHAELASPTLRAIVEGLSREATVYLVNSGPEDRDNAAVTALDCVDRLVGCTFPVTFRAALANYGRQALTDARLEIRLDGAIVRTVPVEPLEPAGDDGSPGAVRHVEFQLEFPRPGSHAVSVRLLAGGDALAVDDVRARSLDVVQGVRVLAVDGRAAGAEVSETFYLVRALAPQVGTEMAGHFAPVVVSDLELAATSLADTAVVVLANVRSLPAAQWARLEQFVRAGGGLMIACGDRPSAEFYNRDAAALLPAELGAPSDPPAAASADAPTLTVLDWTHPVFADFERQPVGGLLAARFERFRSAAPAADARVLLRFTNDAPALVERTVGRGRVMLWTSTLNMAWNNLPAKPDFVPLMLNVLGHLAPRLDEPRNVTVGQAVVEWADAAPTRTLARLRGPHGHDVEVPVVALDGRPGVRVSASPTEGGADVPGVYELAVGGARRKLCVNPVPDESDLCGLDESRLRDALGEHVVYLERPERLREQRPVAPREELSASLFGMVFVVVLLETLAATWFGHRR